jgi:hypothetical protein
MFSKADPTNVLKRVRVAWTTRLGETEAGVILVPAHHNLRQALNDEGPFVELETDAGRQSFILKTEIARIDPLDRGEAKAKAASDGPTRFDANDARVVLGVAGDATDDEIHAAWRDLAKAYHPDRLTALGLPNEMMRHAERVLSRINVAYQRLKSERDAPPGR